MTKKIVIVDDSKVGPLLEEMLKKEKGHQTVRYTHGRDAISSIGESSCFDLAVVDVGLPDMSGERVIEYLVEKYPTRTVICITSYRGHQSPSASRTIHKGSASRIRQLVDILEESCREHNYSGSIKQYAYCNPLLRDDP
ncbi:Regulator of RpoS [uncultured archaeon]|nr:Regulator of RpoS [uncultured archaeon]